jgi:hypothetical protein
LPAGVSNVLLKSGTHDAGKRKLSGGGASANPVFEAERSSTRNRLK